MSLNLTVRRLLLPAHVVSSVGWLGAILAFIALGVAGLSRPHDGGIVQAVYPAMELVGWYALVPLSGAALLTGLSLSLATEWGLFRHYWVAAKFVLTVGATGLLLIHMPSVSRAAALASQGPVGAEFSGLQVRLLIDAVLATLVLLVATGLSIYKPGGLTAYGFRKQEELARRLGRRSSGRLRRMWVWPYALAAGVLILVALLHLTGVVGHH